MQEHGQPSFGGGFNFSVIFPELRRNPGKAEFRVNLFFGFRGNSFVCIDRNRPYSLSVSPIFSARWRNGDIVIFAARKILHRRAIAFGRQRPHIHLDSFQSDFRACLIFSVAEHLMDTRKVNETFQRGSGIGPVTKRSRSPTVSFPRRRLPAAVTFSTPELREILDEFVGRPPRERQQEPAGTAAILLNGPKDLLFEFCSHSGQCPQLLFIANPLQIVDGADSKMLEQEGNALRPEALNLQQLESGGWILLSSN